jgi:hypothetical protein
VRLIDFFPFADFYPKAQKSKEWLGMEGMRRGVGKVGTQITDTKIINSIVMSQ